jgi:hypothetical protein
MVLDFLAVHAHFDRVKLVSLNPQDLCPRSDASSEGVATGLSYLYQVPTGHLAQQLS